MNRRIVPIRGMHCRSCALLLEESLGRLRGVEKVKVSLFKSRATIYSSKPIGVGKIKRAVTEAGYELGTADRAAWASKEPKDYRDLALALALLMALYLLARMTGFFALAVSSADPSNLLVVLAVGLTAGISTCMAVVGGLVLGVSARHAEKHPEASVRQRFRPHLFFNLGRIGAYTLLGGLIGLGGKAFQLSGTGLGAVTIGVGVFMLIVGLKLTEISPRFNDAGLALPALFSRSLGRNDRHEREYSNGNSVAVGALTFFLPCGFTQAMQLYALTTGSFWSGAAIMGVFALGTAPGLLGVGGLTSLVRGAGARKFFKFAGVLVVVLAVVNIGNGYRLTGWDIFGSSGAATASATPDVEVVEGVQVVRMVEHASGYRPRQFTIRRGVPVKWIIDAQAPSSCAASLISPKIGVRRLLKKGENIIEFTPSELGEIKFSCSMGMYTGSFIVVEDPGGAAGESAGLFLPPSEPGTPAST